MPSSAEIALSHHGEVRWAHRWLWPVLGLWLCCGSIGCGPKEATPAAVPAIDAARFRSEYATSEQPVVILFRDQSAESYRMKARFFAAEGDFADLARFATMNSADNTELMSKEGLSVTPTIALFDRGELVVAIEGEIEEMTISLWLNRAIPLAMMQQRGLEESPVVELTDANFDEFLAADGSLVLVDFWATWCGPCQLVAPQVELVSMIHAGKLRVGKVDVDAAQQVARRYEQGSLPFLVVLKNGEEIARRTGAPPGPVLRKWVAGIVASGTGEGASSSSTESTSQPPVSQGTEPER